MKSDEVSSSRRNGMQATANSAGRQHSHDSILDIGTEDFDWTLKTNLYALFWITRAAIAHMPPGAAIVNTASVNAYDPAPNLLDYAVTKAAIANAGQPAEIAPIYVELASAQSTYVTGQIYGASGGAGNP